MCRSTPIFCLYFLLLPALIFSLRHEFVYVPTPVNWTFALNYCRQHYTDLATVGDQAEHNELLKIAGMGNIWLGLYQTRGDGVFVWTDQSTSSFRPWETGQPYNQLCVNVYQGKWYDRDCIGPVPFACYIDRKRQIVRVEVKSSQNLNNPAVMAEILGKMEQILKEKGLAQYAKLSWRTQSNGNVFQKKYQKSDATKQICVPK
ncbi:putative C-type lectin domain family 20 member A [Labeo rohita]|uniref:putative C-type lectin domain family 20 member A n=1 Tax=Labeo rohita TaxID=84645 RepID=UPI0021E2557C|nr:putative C-type lectin domain family 20 member A [Labeo rohita]